MEGRIRPPSDAAKNNEEYHTSKYESSSVHCSARGLSPKKSRRAESVKAFERIPDTVINTTINSLKSITVEKPLDSILLMSPLYYFCYVQCMLQCEEFKQRIQLKKVTYTLIREGIFNVLAILEDKVEKIEPVSTPAYRDLATSMVNAVMELETSLAATAKAKPIFWCKIIHEINSRPMAPLENLSFRSLIPKVSFFESDTLIGKGGFGSVYKALHVKSKQVFAIKLVPTQRFEAENKATNVPPYAIDKTVAAIMEGNPYITQLHSSFIAEEAEFGAVYVSIMEYFCGVDLCRYYESAQPTLSQLHVHLLSQMTMAIQQIHLQGIIHRDIKASNFLVSLDGHIKLIDFDICKECLAHFNKLVSRSYFRRTCNEFRGGGAVGTEAYVAPEVLKNRPFGRSIDFWALGVTLFKMFCGSLPFRGTKIQELILKVEPDYEEFIVVDEDGERLQSFCQKLLTKFPPNRLGSRSYNEIFDHQVFEHILWKTLHKVSMDLPRYPHIAQSVTSPISGIDDILMMGATHKKHYPALGALKDTVDVNTRLYTFTSEYFRSILLNKSSISPKENKTGNVRHCKDLIDTQIQHIDTSSVSYAVSGRQGPEALAKTVEIILRKPLLCFTFSNPVGLKKAMRPDGKYSFYVKKIHRSARFINDNNRLVEGDIVLKLNNMSLEGNIMEAVANSLVLTSSDGDIITFHVMADNPLRTIHSQPFKVREQLLKFGAKTFTFMSTPEFGRLACFASQNTFGFDLSLSRTWTDDASRTETICLVTSADPPNQKPLHDSQEKIYLGDVVLSINEQSVSTLSRDWKKLLNSCKITVEVLQCSPLRVLAS